MDQLKTKKMAWKNHYAHIDMMAFFASVEQLDFPELSGKPVVVTNGKEGSTIITASYEARAFGIKTGVKLKEALQVCPQLIRRASRPKRYVAISQKIMQALTTITPDQEVFSIDECFLYLTPILHFYDSLDALATKIRYCVFTASGGLSSSIGISEGKLTAKLAAKSQKGQTTILPPWQTSAYIGSLPVSEICGIGKKITQYLNQYGIFKCADIRAFPEDILAKRFGHIGKRLYSVCLGHDPQPIITDIPTPKSMGHGKVLPPATTDITLISATLAHQVEKLGARLRQHHLKATKIEVGLKLNTHWIADNFRCIEPTSSSHTLWCFAKKVLEKWRGEGVFQVQINAKPLIPSHIKQYDLFYEPSLADQKNQYIDALKDKVNQRFGGCVLMPATMLQAKDNVPVISPAWRPKGPKQSIL